MPQNDRHRTRIVQIEYDALMDFSRLPYEERLTLVLMTDGKASLMLNEKAITISAPCVLCISHDDHVRLIEQNRLSAACFSFNPGFLNSSLSFENLNNDVLEEIEDQHDLNMLMPFLTRDEYYNGVIDLPAKTYLRLSEWLSIIGTEVYAQSDGYWTCRIRRYLLQTLYLIDDLYMNRRSMPTIRKTKSPVDIVLEYIHTNYQNPISLDLLCDVVHMNRTSLNRKFKMQTERTVMEYLLYYRLKIACETLTHTNLSLNEISDAVGFKYDTYFIKRFTAKMGVTPTEYRQRAWK